jgi:hypothetical protein
MGAPRPDPQCGDSYVGAEMNDAAKSASKQRGRPFQKGQSGNPAGRPVGSRNKVTLLCQRLLDEQAEKIVAKIIHAAVVEGDVGALKLCLERLVPPVKGRPLSFPLPQTQDGVIDVPGAVESLLREVANGLMTADEAGGVAKILDTVIRARQGHRTDPTKVFQIHLLPGDEKL